MRHRTVAEVMTRGVVAVPPDATFREVVQVLARHGISGVPVVDAEHEVLGVVTEGDLLGRQARTGGITLWELVRHKLYQRKNSGRTAAELMTAPAVTVSSAAPLTIAAATLARSGIKRAPVLDAEHKLVGIVSRRDVLSVYRRDDAELAAEIRSEVLEHAMCLLPEQVSVAVEDGVVTLCGTVERTSAIDVLTALTAAVDGVVAVHPELTAQVDDTRTAPPPPENVGVFSRHKR